jgi:hypothetical protein
MNIIPTVIAVHIFKGYISYPHMVVFPETVTTMYECVITSKPHSLNINRQNMSFSAQSIKCTLSDVAYHIKLAAYCHVFIFMTSKSQPMTTALQVFHTLLYLGLSQS